LSFKNHVIDKINKANSMLGILKRNFRNLNQDTFIMLYSLHYIAPTLNSFKN